MNCIFQLPARTRCCSWNAYASPFQSLNRDEADTSQTTGQQTVYFPKQPQHWENRDTSLRAFATSAGQAELPKYRVLTKTLGRREDAGEGKIKQ